MIRLRSIALLYVLCALGGGLVAQVESPAAATPGPGAPEARAPIPSDMDGRRAEQLRELVERALEVQVEVKLSQTAKVVWSSLESRFTVPGIGVSMRLEEENLLVKLQLTPYRKQGDLIYLLIQGQVWIRSASTGTLQNFSTAKGTTVHIGEPLTFYPLGIPENPDASVLSVLITVKPIDSGRIQDVQQVLARQKTAPATGADSPSSAPLPATGESKKPEQGTGPRKP